MTKKIEVKDARLPNLSTILMVEDVLKKSKTLLSIPDIKKSLPKQVMHQTLKITLKYLWQSKKVEYLPEGIKWTFRER
jgi:adenine/guanine phosphoribosyltransferase-like PRPP-binding protein